MYYSKDELWESHRKGVCYCMKYIQGMHFSVTNDKNVNTVIYEINKNDETKGKNVPKYTIDRLDSIQELRNDEIKKTFFVDEPKKSGNQLLFLSFENDQVTVNMGVLKNDEVKLVKKPVPMKFDTIYNDTGKELYKEFNYTPNKKRSISIIDPETGDEVKPVLYYDSVTNEIKGKCKLNPNKSYLAFEIKPNM